MDESYSNASSQSPGDALGHGVEVREEGVSLEKFNFEEFRKEYAKLDTLLQGSEDWKQKFSAQNRRYDQVAYVQRKIAYFLEKAEEASKKASDQGTIDHLTQAVTAAYNYVSDPKPETKEEFDKASKDLNHDSRPYMKAAGIALAALGIAVAVTLTGGLAAAVGVVAASAGGGALLFHKGRSETYQANKAFDALKGEVDPSLYTRARNTVVDTSYNAAVRVGENVKAAPGAAWNATKRAATSVKEASEAVYNKLPSFRSPGGSSGPAQ